MDLIGAIPVPVAKKTIFLKLESLRKKVPMVLLVSIDH